MPDHTRCKATLTVTTPTTPEHTTPDNHECGLTHAHDGPHRCIQGDYTWTQWLDTGTGPGWSPPSTPNAAGITAAIRRGERIAAIPQSDICTKHACDHDYEVECEQVGQLGKPCPRIDEPPAEQLSSPSRF